LPLELLDLRFPNCQSYKLSYISQNCLFCPFNCHFKWFKCQSPINNFKSIFIVASQPGTLYHSSLQSVPDFIESKVGPGSVQTPLKMYLMCASANPREGKWDSGISQGGIWLAVGMPSSILARIPGFRQWIIPEPRVPSRRSQARGTRL
jgi:hypothetical protein